MIYKPHPYQAYATKRILEQANVGLFLDCGLGKSAITLTAIDALIYDYLCVSRVLVIAPKKVAEATWQAEARKWDHLHRLTIATALGTAQERAAAVEAGADVTIINRENVVWLVEEYGARWPFDMVVVDESSSFKNPAAKRFKALRRMLPRIHSIVILTGTPAPNGLMDLWSQVYLLDRGERLGRFITHYRERYFDHNPWRHEYVAKPGAFDAVQARIADICVSMKAEDWLQLPELIVDDVPVALQ
ncbi:MAG: ATP-dependent helicase, partial [Oscillospiraceae bacterium]|nr:ATP-dependent helicase [Oscillospiraceae bacterium]